MSTQILIVEDEATIAELIAINLKHAGFSYEVAADAVAARASVDNALPDLILLDWMLPSESGLSLAKHWRSQERTRTLSIIMVTARGDDADIIMGLDAGADDYIVKPFSPQEMLARIRAVLRRKAPEAAGEVIELAGIVLDPQKQLVFWHEQSVLMSPMELKLFSYFITHPDRVLERSRLLDRVWGDHVFIEERTVDVHVKRLRGVLAQANMPPIIETVRGIGYQFNSKLLGNNG